MRIRPGGAALVALALVMTSCSDSGPVGPGVAARPQFTMASALPAVRISEIHYDNASTDVGEAIEVSFPAGTNLADWSVVLYNGNGGAVYSTTSLGALAPSACGARAVVVVSYPSNGIQNGDPDGIALVGPGHVSFISYEGTFTAVGGPANGMVSTDIGVREAGTETAGQSLKLNGAGVWSGPSAHSFGSCNDADEAPQPPPPPPPPVTEPVSGAVRINEIHYDDAGTDVDEKIEVEGPAGASLAGWSIVLYNGNGGGSYGTIALSGTIAGSCDGRGVLVFNGPSSGIQNGDPDGLALVDAAGAVVEFLSYEGTFTATNGPANGRLSTDIGVRENGEPEGQSLQRKRDGSWRPVSAHSFGSCNSDTAPPAPSNISFSGRTPSDPPLPVGFQDQIFATLRDASGTVVPTTFTWSSETPTIAQVDADGVMTAVGVGTATIRATAADGSTRTYSLPTRIATPSTTARYAGNAGFGIPADGTPSDDFVVEREQYSYSYNRNRGTPNWVSYNIEATHFGPEDRCDCFTADPQLPQDFPRYTTAAYTGAGTFHGYGIDRGHLARSFDRTAGSLDNATTFYFSNIIPQAADQNQGPWAALESYLGDFARLQNREVYVVAGVAGSKGTVKDEGRITIPEKTWKVAVIMPRDEGKDDIRTYADLDRIEYVAVIMPNTPGIRNVDWRSYEVTVDDVERLSGYDLLDLLPDHLETALESDTRPPKAVLDGPYTSAEGSAVELSAAASTDPDGDALTYQWSFGDGASSGGVVATHTYRQDGAYRVRLVVTDIRGLADTVFTTATVSNVAPAIAPFAGAELLPGESYGASGSFTDPGADSWSGTVSYGDGSGTSALELSGKSFELSHTYTTPGAYTVTVRISDDDVTSSRTSLVTVLTYAQALRKAGALVQQLVDAGALNAGNGNSLQVKLNAAGRTLDRDRHPAQLEALLNELQAMVNSGRLTAAQAAPLQTLIGRVLRSLSL